MMGTLMDAKNEPRTTPHKTAVALAASLFESGAISAGTAARMAGKPLADMLMILSSLGIPLTGTPEESIEDLQAEMAAADAWVVKPTA